MNDQDKQYLQLALAQAKRSINQGGFAAGAILVKERHVIAEGISIGYLLHDPTSHAEIAAIRSACQKLQTSSLSGATMYASLASCLMCFSAANWAGISRIVFTGKKTPQLIEKLYYEGTSDTGKVNTENNTQIELVYVPDFEEKSVALIKEWEEKQK